MFKRFIEFHWQYYYLGILLTIVVMAVGAFTTRKIGLDTNLRRLLPRKTESVIHLDEIDKKAGSSNSLLLMVWGDSLEKRLEAATAFKDYVENVPQFARSVQFTTPKSFLEEKKYMLVPMESLESIHRKIEAERKKNKAVTDPFGLEEIIENEQAQTSGSLSKQTQAEQKKGDEEELDRAKEFLDRLDRMRPYYVTEDGAFLSIRVVPATENFDIKKNQQLIEKFQRIVDDFKFERFSPEIETVVYGNMVKGVDRFEAILSDLSFGGFGLALILVLVVIFFRTFWAPIVLVPPLLAGLLGGLGIVTLIERKLNTIAVFLVLIVFGVGIEFGIHLWARMLQERKFRNCRISLYETWRTTGRATITSAVALLTGFALLTISSFEGFSQFGRVAIILLLCTAGGFLVFMPSWIVFAERTRKFKPWAPSLAEITLSLAKEGRLDIPKGLIYSLRLLSIFLIPICVVSSLLYIDFDYKFKDTVVLKDRTPDEYDGGTFTERLKPSAVAVFKDLPAADKFVKEYEANKDDFPDIAMMTSLSQFYPLDQEARIEKLQFISDDLELSWLKDWEDEKTKQALIEIKERAYDYVPYELEDVPFELKNPFMASDDSENFMVYFYDLGGATDGRKAIKFSDASYEFLNRFDGALLFSGQEIIFADIVRRVIQEGPWLVLGMLALVFLICFLDFRNFIGALITVSPVLFGFLLTGLAMAVLREKINFFNMAALASLGSMVVDNSIHLYHRYKGFQTHQELCPGRLASFAVCPTVIVCTLTSICGYGGMVFARHTGISSLGTVAVAGLVCCMLSAVLIFPAWLMSTKHTKNCALPEEQRQVKSL